MTAKVTLNENIVATYSDNKVYISGQTFKATLFLDQNSLMNIYMGGQGAGTARLIIDNVLPVKANT
jgi:predicted nucleic acid-binding protein